MLTILGKNFFLNFSILKQIKLLLIQKFSKELDMINLKSNLIYNLVESKKIKKK